MIRGYIEMKHIMVWGCLLLFVTLAVTQVAEQRENYIISFVNLLKKSTNSTSEISAPQSLLNEYINLSTTLNMSESSLPRDIISLIADKYKELDITPEQASKMIDIVKSLEALST